MILQLHQVEKERNLSFLYLMQLKSIFFVGAVGSSVKVGQFWSEFVLFK